MIDHDELDWLLEHGPHPDPPSPVSTERARAALLAHGEQRRRVRRRTNAMTAAAALAAVAAVTVLTGGGPRRVQTHAAQRAGVTPAAGHVHRPPLLKLAADVHAMPSAPQPGDATLVVRYTAVNGRHEVDGAVYGGYDLYTDAGRYYYAPDSLSELQQDYNAGQTVPDAGDEARALDTIAAAAGGTPAQARAAVLSTWPKPSGRPHTLAELRPKLRQLPPAKRRQAIRAIEGHPTATQVRLSEDSEIYIAATQALEAGAGRSNVRAGAMKALSTLEGVTQTPTEVNGVDALRVDFPDGGTPEIIWLDVGTGVPIQEKDGSDSATAFAVQRVSAAHLPAQVSPRARLR